MLRLWALRLWALCALLLAGWAFPVQAQPKDRLVIGMNQLPSNMHPFISNLLVRNYLLAVSRRLVTRFDASGKVVCQLCTEVPSLDNGRAKLVDLPDGKRGMEVTFTLRPGLKWGDGTPLTTKDIVFGAEVERTFIPPPNVMGVEAIDDLS